MTRLIAVIRIAANAVVAAAKMTHWVEIIVAGVLLKPTGVFVALRGLWHRVYIQTRNMLSAKQT